jgi:hypothetical protein
MYFIVRDMTYDSMHQVMSVVFICLETLMWRSRRRSRRRSNRRSRRRGRERRRSRWEGEKEEEEEEEEGRKTCGPLDISNAASTMCMYTW